MNKMRIKQKDRKNSSPIFNYKKLTSKISKTINSFKTSKNKNIKNIKNYKKKCKI